ncbi:MAG: EI24 domain-containing protein [Betaproteobacteria bacterium]|nr:EI24 domain-containing protein [Betaproteobacteria bacterium]
MRTLMIAFGRAFSSLLRPKMWLPLLAPALVSLVVWVFLSVFALHALAGCLIDMPPFSWASTFVAVWFGKFLALIGGWALIFAAAYLTALILTAVFLLPALLRRIAADSYADLALMGKDSFTAGAMNSLIAILGFAAGWILTLPLWFVPGLGLLLPFFWLAWLNRRTFSYDVLCLHASEEEWQMLRKRHARSLFLIGLSFAVLAHIPILGILAPTLAMLTYIHFGLEALRQLRGGAILAAHAQVIREAPSQDNPD